MASDRLNPVFQHDTYVFRRKVFRFFGGFFQVYDEHGTEILYSDQARFRLREDFVVSSKDSNQQLMRIKTPHMVDLWAEYEVRDPDTNAVIGSLRRKFLKSMFKDEWTFFSHDGREIGRLSESSWARALLSRFWGVIPQNYHVYPTGGPLLATLHRHFNPFVLRYTMRILEPNPVIDRRLLVAAGILLAAIERRQE